MLGLDERLPKKSLGWVVLLDMFSAHGRRAFVPSPEDATRRFGGRGGRKLFDRAVADLMAAKLLKPCGAGRYRITTRLVLTDREHAAWYGGRVVV